MEDRTWYCCCNSVEHSVQLTWADEGDEELGWITIHDQLQAPAHDAWSLRGWWMRLRAAWAMIRWGHYTWVSLTLTAQTAHQIAGELQYKVNEYEARTRARSRA